MEILTLTYFILSYVLVMYEVYMFSNVIYVKALFNLPSNKVKELEDSKVIEIALHTLIGVFYILWLLIGLFTNQWFWMAIIILMGRIPKRKLPLWGLKLDSLITIGILVFIPYNYYQLKFDIVSYLMDLIWNVN